MACTNLLPIKLMLNKMLNKTYLKGILVMFCKLQVGLRVGFWWEWWNWIRIRRKTAVHIQEGRLAQGRTWKQTWGRGRGKYVEEIRSHLFYEAHNKEKTKRKDKL